ncbi:hypothetical protein [Metabacillus bambusae]|uniref:Uncharacterized protein n=1 Tax=Metabacillus bambusae TaxID=2795218 RepID=A0ABS3MZ79_9BACI|nr:hypothetical protein [Metabacillus bambusae]MBO1511205.1 hypothetical protein [Metabacillus bambusae]
MNDDIQFLKDQQNEFNTQEYDSQESSRYWTVGDYKMVSCPEGCKDEYHVHLPNREYYGEINDLLKDY